jgi:MFS family permease
MRSYDRQLLVSSFLTRLADQILLFVVPLLVFKVTGSASWSGSAFFLEALPRFIAFPVAGALCDRVSPLKLMEASQLLRSAVCGAGVAGFYALGGIGWLIAISACAGALTTQGFMAREAMLAHYFTGDAYRKSLVYIQIADQVGMLGGPIVAAALLDVASWQQVVLVTGCLFLVSDYAFSRWIKGSPDPAPVATPRAAATANPYRIAARHLMTIPSLLEIVLLASGANLVVGVTLATSAAMFTGTYAQSTSAFASLQIAGSIATVLMLVIVARVKLSANFLGTASYVVILLGGLVTGLGNTALFYAIGFVTIVGFDKMFSIVMRSTRTKLIPAEDFGKTVGLMALLNNLSQPLAGIVVGTLAGRAGVPHVILLMTFCMALMGLAPVMLRRKRARESRLDVARKKCHEDDAFQNALDKR